MSGQTDFLYAEPSFWEGAARILDFGDNLTRYNSSVFPGQADAIASRMDWLVVYQDLHRAFETMLKQLEKRPETSGLPSKW